MIGLLTIKEAARIRTAVKNQTSVGPLTFDIYGIDKYFGQEYTDCNNRIEKIREACRKYDSSPEHAGADTIDPLAEGIIRDINAFLVKQEILNVGEIDPKRTNAATIQHKMNKYRSDIHRTVGGKIRLDE